MPMSEKDLEARSLRMILSSVLKMIGDFSYELTHDTEMLPKLLMKLSSMSEELAQADEAARKEREKMLEEVSKWLSPAEEAADPDEKKEDCEDCDCEESSEDNQEKDTSIE